MKRRLLSLFLTGALLCGSIALSGCAPKDDFDLNIWSYDTATTEAMVSEYNKVYPDVKINIVPVDGNAYINLFIVIPLGIAWMIFSGNGIKAKVIPIIFTIIFAAIPFVYLFEDLMVQTDYKLIEFKPAVPFQTVGFLAKIAEVIANQGMNILIVSTFSKDYIMIKEELLEKGIQALKDTGFPIEYEE